MACKSYVTTGRWCYRKKAGMKVEFRHPSFQLDSTDLNIFRVSHPYPLQRKCHISKIDCKCAMIDKLNHSYVLHIIHAQL